MQRAVEHGDPGVEHPARQGGTAQGGSPADPPVQRASPLQKARAAGRCPRRLADRHAPVDGRIFRRLQEQVENLLAVGLREGWVVAHQHSGMDTPTMLLAGLTEALQPRKPVRIILEYILASLPTSYEL